MQVLFEILASDHLLLITAAFFLAGLVKGIVGLGLPSVALGLMTLVVGLREAMVLLLAPALATNLYQAAVGGELASLLRRFWPLLVAVLIGAWLGVAVLAAANVRVLSIGLGLLICAYALLSLRMPKFPSVKPYELWLSPLTGLFSGVLTGVTGTLGYPGVVYFQALGLKRDVLIQAMGIFFVVSTGALGLALADRQLISGSSGALSAFCLIPALAGMVAGRRIRRKISEPLFRTLFLLALTALGLAIVVKAALGV